jgi:predicted metal-dependent HD superfamily phosphohydrolase
MPTNSAAVRGAIDELLASEPIDDAAAVQLAGWLHDVVYDPTRSDNELESARYARRALSMIRAPKAVTDETARLIELTAGHEVAPGDRDAMVLVDADLSILGATAADYDRYAADIRAEYGHVPDGDFRVGRRRVLEGFLARERIFLTETGHGWWDAAARSNLEREIDRLR